MKNAGEAVGPHPAFFEKSEAQRLPENQYTARFQAIPGKLMKPRVIWVVTARV
ncbi:MAG: hypothetical protein ACR2IV_04230 [Bryobacteraceae bacterium]